MTRRSTKQPKSRKRRFRLPKNSLAKRIKKRKQADTLKIYIERLGFDEDESFIFLDGSFLFHCFVHKLNILNIRNIFDGMKIVIVTTDCTWKELGCYVNNFGKDGSWSICSSMRRHLEIIACGHKDNMHARDCIMSIVGEHNENKDCIASQDSFFLTKLSENPLIPVVTIEGGDFALKCLSKKQKRELYSVNSMIKPEDDPDTDETRLMERVKFYAFERVKVDGDGNCVLRALSDQMTHSQVNHEKVRKLLVDQFLRNKKLYKEYVKMYMDLHPETYGRQHTYSKFLRVFSENETLVPRFTLQAASDFFKAKIICLTSEEEAVFDQYTPHDVDDPERVWYLSILARDDGHVDSLYPKRTPSESCRHLYDLST